MSYKVSAEDLAAYIQAATTLAENVSQDIIAGGETSEDTVDALAAFLEASEVLDYLTSSLTVDKKNQH